MSFFKINDVVWVRNYLKPGIIHAIGSGRSVPTYRVHCYVAGDWTTETIAEYDLSHYMPRAEVLAKAMYEEHPNILRAEKIIVDDDAREELIEEIERGIDRTFLEPTGT